MIVHAFHATPLGRLLLVGELAAGGNLLLTGIFMEEHRRGPEVDPASVEDVRAFGDVTRQLDEYFAGSRRSFDLPLAPAGTAFQSRVWDALARIPWGTTVTYGGPAVRAPPGRSVPRSGATRSRSWCPATGWSGRTGRSPATRAAWTARRSCWRSKARR